MTTVTIEAIEAEHQRIGQLIEQFKAQAATAVYHFPEALITLAPGENYAGLVIGKDGEPSYHLVLLPAQADDITWDTAMQWASNQCSEHVASLPTRREQALLYANLKEEFEDRTYWSCQAHETESGWAWIQGFINGLQLINREGNELRARAVRRLTLE